MRKAMLLLLGLLIACGGTIYAAASEIYQSRDAVTFRESVLYGDRSAANGLEMHIKNKCMSQMFWDTVHTIGPQDKTETQYHFSQTKMHREPVVVYTGINMENLTFDTMDFTPGNEKQRGIERAYQELFEDAEIGETATRTIRLKDYIDFYPVAVVDIDLPGTEFDMINARDLYRNCHDLDELDKGIFQNIDSPDIASLALSKYFQIPVMEEEMMEISLSKTSEDRVFSIGAGSTNSDNYYIYTWNAITDDACYFTINTHSNDGQQMDISHLPDGYGIFCLPYDENRRNADGTKICSVDMDAFDMVYALDPSIQVLDLAVNHEQTKLLLYAVENGQYTMTVIDLATMDTLQKLELGEWTHETEWFAVYDEGDYLVLLINHQLLLLTQDDGTYTLQYSCDLGPEEFRTSLYDIQALAFDGERVAFLGYPAYEIPKQYMVAVYDSGGLQYLGEYQASSMQKEDSYYGEYVEDEYTLSWIGNK